MQQFSETTMTLRPTPAEQRRPVLIPEPHARSSKSLKKQHADLRARSNALESDRQAAARRRAEFSEALEQPDGDADIAGLAAEVRGDQLRLLRSELALRNDLGSYLSDWHESGRERVTSLREELEATRADVLKRLIQIGYDDPATHRLSRSRVLPGDLNRHPRVVEARLSLVSQQGVLSDGPTVASNGVELSEIRRLIQREAAGLASV